MLKCVRADADQVADESGIAGDPSPPATLIAGISRKTWRRTSA
jgi:hypothetical protein